MPNVQLNNHAVHWQENRGDGRNPTPLCFLHCSLASLNAWRPVLRHMGDREWIALDLPGHGDTDLDASTDMLSQTQVMLEYFVDKPTHLVGHSFGAVTALRFALNHPDRVKALTLYEPVLLGVLKDADHPMWDIHCQFDAELARQFAAKDREGAARSFMDRWGSRGGFNVLPDAAKADVMSKIHLILESADILFNDTPLRTRLDELGNIGAPVTIVSGGMSDDAARAAYGLIANAIPGAELIEFADADHMGPLSHAAEFAQEIARTEKRV